MRTENLCGRRLGTLALLTLLGTLVGCGGQTQAPKVTKPTALDHTNVRGQFKENFKSAVENMAKEAKSSSSQALSGALSSITGLLGHSGGSSEIIDPDLLNGMIDQLLDSNIAKSIFDEANISSRTDTEAVYEVKTSVCEKVAELSAAESEMLMKACQQFLANNALEFRVSKTDGNTMNVALWHGVVVDGAADKKFVMSFSTSPNSIGARANLSGAKDLIETFLSIAPQDPFGSTRPSSLKKLAGVISVQLRFKSATSESGCKGGETLCFTANVDEDLDFEMGDADGMFLRFGKSTLDNPTLMIAAGADGSFKGNFNLGAFDFGTKGQMDLFSVRRLFVESAQFAVTVPKMSDGSLNVLVENFKAGKNPSFFEGFGKKFVVDLTHDSRMIEKVKVAMDASKLLIDLSPFGLILSLSDESDGQCKAYESLKFATNKDETTLLSFTGGGRNYAKAFNPFAHLYARGGNSCNETRLLAYPYLSLLKVAGGVDCEMPYSVAVKQGSLEMSYMYHFNDSTEKTTTLTAAKDQCLRI
jgi:hypothetical protein